MEHVTQMWNDFVVSSVRLYAALTADAPGSGTFSYHVNETDGTTYTKLSMSEYDGSRYDYDFMQVYDYFPSVRKYYPFTFENEWNGYPWATFCLENMAIPFILSAIYFVSIFGVQYFMRNRQPFGLKTSLAAWNLLLSVFSFMGAMRTVPHILNNLYQHGYYFTVCAPAPTAYGLAASGMWTTLFIFSKIPELFDTAFIVLRKKPLIFLHWYHHITVLLYCWHAYATRASSGLYFIAMNYSVHAVMYFYYFAMAVNIWPKWLNPIFITFFQLSQMAVGITVCVSTFWYKSQGDACEVQDDNLFWGAMMYASYFGLFFKFLVERYFFAKPKSKKGAKKSVEGKADALKKEE